MKKLLFFFALLSTILLSGCSVFTETETDVGFFGEALLAECRLTGMPTPDGELRNSENKVYCSLTQEKLQSYSDKLVEFILEKEDIYYKSYYYETGNPGGIFYIPEYRFAPLTADSEISYMWLAFSLTEQLNDHGNSDYYGNGISISLIRKDGRIGSYAYNTVIELDTDPSFILYDVSKHEVHSGEWRSSEIAHWYQYTCGCESRDIAALHVDDDTDLICDVCGYNMPPHEHTSKTYSDEIGHGWSYTCGCPTPPNFAQHFDGDGDGGCDDCAYQMNEGAAE